MNQFHPTSYPGVFRRQFEEHDSEALYQIFVNSRNDLSAAVADWSETQQDAFLRIQFHTQQDQYHKLYPNARFDVIIANDEVIGHRVVAPVDGEIRLVDLSLLPWFRHRGIGLALIRDLLDEAAGLKQCVSLHVLQGNPAIRLYERLGFTETGLQGIYQQMYWHPSSNKTTAEIRPPA